MSKEIYQDELGLYLVEYNAKGEPKKVYCNENGEKELFQDAQGPYYVEYDEKGLPAKAYCDENGNRLDLLGTSGQVVVTESAVIREDAGADTQLHAPQQEEVAYQESTRQVIQEKNHDSVAAVTSMTPPNNNVFVQEEKEKKTRLTWIGIVLVAIGLIFAFASLFSKPSVNLENYQISFAPKGTNGQAKPDVKIEGIPVAENADGRSQEEKTAIDKLLSEPIITYSKPSDLANGDKVEVTLNIDSSKAAEYDLEVVGKFKQSFTVSGLSEGSKSSNAESSDKKSSSNEPNKNWFAVDGVLRPGDASHPDTQLRNGFNSWASVQGLSLERMKGGAEFRGVILGNKVLLNDKTIELRFLRYQGETQESIKAGELLSDVYNVVGIFSDKSSVIYILAVYNGEAKFIKADLDGGKPETKDGLIVFEDTDNSEVKNMLQGVIDRMK